MKKRTFLLFIGFRDITMLATFVLAQVLERAMGERLITMIALFSLLFIWMHIRDLFQEKYSRFLFYSFLVDVVLLVLLDSSSKYVVNYYFNIYYFYVLIAAGFIPNHRQRPIASFLIIAAAFIKYYRFIEVALYDPDPAYNVPFVFSYIFFTLMIFITVAVFFNYSRLLSEEKDKLDSLNRELEMKNERIKELTIFEERTRIAREIHDSVGHNLTGLVMNLDFCEKLAEADETKVKPQIANCREIAKECLSEIRRSVQALKPKSLEQLPLIKSLEELVNDSRQKFSLDISLLVKDEIYKTEPDFDIVIYRAVQEAITNAVRHGNATKVDVTVNYGESSFSVFIKDDGKGAKKIHMGSGLSGMVHRVKELHGEISFFRDNGFMINITIPKGGRGNE